MSLFIAALALAAQNASPPPSSGPASNVSLGSGYISDAGQSPDPRSFFRTREYPGEALRNQEEGAARFQVTVGVDGRASDCVITGSSGSRSLDEASCRIMIERGRFTPARDQSGNPVQQVVNRQITWRLTAPPPPPRSTSIGTPAELITAGSGPRIEVHDDAMTLPAPEQGTADGWIVVGSNGRVTRCLITRSGGIANVDDEICALVLEHARFKPALGRSYGGRPPLADFDIVSARFALRPEASSPPVASSPPSLPAQRAKAISETLGQDDDYPASALRNEEEGNVGYRLSISPEGVVSECVIVASSGFQSLDNATCRIFTTRARFEPARNAQGEPVADTHSAQISWRIRDY